MSQPLNVSADPYAYNLSLLQEAVRIARLSGCSTLLFPSDAFNSTIPQEALDGFACIVMGDKQVEPSSPAVHYVSLDVHNHLGVTPLKTALLLAYIHGYIRYDEKVFCLNRTQGGQRLNLMVAMNVQQAVHPILTTPHILPASVLPETFERALTITTELAHEGREGKAIGTMLILGDAKSFEPYIRPLVLNPFLGHAPAECSLLNSALDETIKEYAQLDGGFIIDGNGVVVNAGVWIQAPCSIQPPSGFGTRHAAAMAFSQAVDCIIITLSSSNRQISLFRNGQMLSLSPFSNT